MPNITPFNAVTLLQRILGLNRNLEAGELMTFPVNFNLFCLQKVLQLSGRLQQIFKTSKMLLFENNHSLAGMGIVVPIHYQQHSSFALSVVPFICAHLIPTLRGCHPCFYLIVAVKLQCWLRKNNFSTSDKLHSLNGRELLPYPSEHIQLSDCLRQHLRLMRQALQEPNSSHFWLALYSGLKAKRLLSFCMKLNQRMCSRNASNAASAPSARSDMI